jgi:hypothetical protein
MSSISPIHAAAAAASVAPVKEAATKPDAAPKGAAALPAGPAATVQLSQKALAALKGDKDWQPGQHIDSL